MRHSCATVLYDLGSEIKDIQSWLGHSTYSITALTYKNKILVGNRLKQSLLVNSSIKTSG
ncbi:MAG: hypothetical protein HFJ84_05350 [Clostridiales bacterium]|nr:hypothetical protein [Clostridiales bacterium]